MPKKTIACVIARTVSTRLPLKVLRNVVDDYSILDFILQRLKLLNNVDEVYLCTSDELVDEILEDVAKKNNIKIYRGSPNAVIERLISVGDIEEADNIIRITGDNVFTSYEYLDEQINIHNANNLDYTRIIDVPIGASAEVMKLSALKDCYHSIDPEVSEYLLLYMFQPQKYKCGVIKIDKLPLSSDYTVTVDTPKDLFRTKTIFKYFQKNNIDIKLKNIIEIIDKYNIENSKIEFTGNVKMPYGKEITFQEFQNDMNNRIKNSIQFTIG